MINKPTPGGKDRPPSKAKAFIASHRDSPLLNLVFSVLVPLVVAFTLEWIARGTLAPNKSETGFFQALWRHFPAYLLSFALLVCVYVFVSQLSGLHSLAVLAVGLVGYVPAIITHYKLTLRGEPFLPWDVTQVGDLMGVSSSLSFSIPPPIIVSGLLWLALAVLAAFVRVPRNAAGRPDIFCRIVSAGAALVCAAGLMLGVFLNPAGSKAMGIVPDSWMQDRYYRYYGVLTGFLTNLQMLNIDQPEGYSAEAAAAIAAQDGPAGPLYAGSPAADGEAMPENPDIIYLMAESFWDVTALPGIEYDRPILPNLSRLAEEGAYGRAYSPSFGGGTCDVEFEALTGFSMEYLPAGSKPFQQYLGEDTFSLPWYLKDSGYQTLAIHGYGRRFWNRDLAYPALGIDTFIASDDFVNPEKKRGFISDNAMVDAIIEEYSARRDDGPLFIHAVTMQNHTTYDRSRYPADELVKVRESPEGLSYDTVGQLEDCATGIREMDAALGKLCDWLEERARPTIVVFWGDHMNPMNDGYSLFEITGYIEEGDTASPKLRSTPLLIWSNFADEKVELGTLSTYNLPMVMMNLYGMETPPMFSFLARQFPFIHGHTKGVTIEPDNTFGYELSEAQQQYFDEHAILQYDHLFGERSLEDYS